MPPVVDQHRFSVADRNAYIGVVAYWQDIQGPRRSRSRSNANSRRRNPVSRWTRSSASYCSDNAKYLRHVYANEGNAKRAARTKWERLQRGVAEFEINLAIGRPEFFPE